MNEYQESLFRASMRVILQPVVEEEEKFIEECSENLLPVPHSLQERIRQIVFRHRMQKFAKVCGQIGRRIAVCILVLFTLMMVACVGIEPLRESIYEAIITWYDEYFRLGFVAEEKVHEVQSGLHINYATLVNDFTILSDDTTGAYRDVVVDYHGEDIYVERMPYVDKGNLYDINLIITEIYIKEQKVIHVARRDNSENLFTWLADDYEYVVYSAMGKEALLAFVEMIVE